MKGGTNMEYGTSFLKYFKSIKVKNENIQKFQVQNTF